MIWLPYAFVSMAEVFGYAATTSPSFFLVATAGMLTKISVCVDPIIYFGFNPQVGESVDSGTVVKISDFFQKISFTIFYLLI